MIQRKSISALALNLLLTGAVCVSASGCAPSFKLKKTPLGFIEVSSSDWDGDGELRMKAPDNVGINITTESNFRGGTLVLWADDLVRKLSERGYVLMRQQEVRAKNGVPGTRFDFAYEPPGGEQEERFYTAVLFVSDAWRVIVQVAGRSVLEAAHQDDLEQIIRDIKISGCKMKSQVCKSPQPRRFETAQPSRPNTGGDDKDDAQAETEAKTAAAKDAPEPAEVEPPADAEPAPSK